MVAATGLYASSITVGHRRCDEWLSPRLPHPKVSRLVEPPQSIMEAIACDANINRAYEWLCSSRNHHRHNSDVWDLRWRWAHTKPRVQQQLRDGTYRFSVVRRFRSGNDIIEYWSAQDALVLKAVAGVLTERFRTCNLSDRCHHVRGNGGAKAAIRRVGRPSTPNTNSSFRTGREALLRQHRPRHPHEAARTTHLRPTRIGPAAAVYETDNLRRRPVA